MAEVGSHVVPTQCSALRKNGFVLLKGHPCKIVEMTMAKTGKHGGAKAHITGIDIFTDKKYEEIAGSTQNVDVPNTERKDYQLVDIDAEGNLTVLDDKGEQKDNFKLPNMCEGDVELAANIKTAFEAGSNVEVTVLSAMGLDCVKAYRILKND